MSRAANAVAGAIWFVLSVIATLLAIVALTLMADGLWAEAIDYVQAACAGWCYALAMKSVAKHAWKGTLRQGLKTARIILGLLLLMEMGVQLFAAIMYGITQHALPALGFSFTMGFPSAQVWCTILNEPFAASGSTAFLLDIPLLVLVVTLWIASEALTSKDLDEH